MNTLTVADIHIILRDLDRIEELTGLLRRAHFDVPYAPIGAAIGATYSIRRRLLDLSLTDVEVERQVEEHNG